MSDTKGDKEALAALKRLEAFIIEGEEGDYELIRRALTRAGELRNLLREVPDHLSEIDGDVSPEGEIRINDYLRRINSELQDNTDD